MQRLYVIRHASAVDCPPAELDHERWLTQAGRHEAALTGRKLKTEKIDLVLSSPLVRALQTAEIVARHARIANIEVLSMMASGADQSTLFDALGARAEARIAIVGHEPDLSTICDRLARAAGIGWSFGMKKGATARFDGTRLPDGAKFRWYMPPGKKRVRA